MIANALGSGDLGQLEGGVIAAVGILVSIVATYFVKVKDGGDPQMALNIGTFGAAAVMAPVILSSV